MFSDIEKKILKAALVAALSHYFPGKSPKSQLKTISEAKYQKEKIKNFIKKKARS